MPATLAELVRGLTGSVTREDAKNLAKLHGHPWKSVLKAIKRRAAAPKKLRSAIVKAANQVVKYGGKPDFMSFDGGETWLPRPTDG